MSKPAITRVVMRSATYGDRWLLKLSRGRWRLSFVIPVLMLRCYGARTGQLRETPLLYVSLPPRLVVVASNGGQSQLPAWYHNLKASNYVDCLVDGEWLQYRWRELGGEERSLAWRQAAAIYPGYGRYQAQQTRQIPVIELSSVAPPAEASGVS